MDKISSATLAHSSLLIMWSLLCETELGGGTNFRLSVQASKAYQPPNLTRTRFSGSLCKIFFSSNYWHFFFASGCVAPTYFFHECKKCVAPTVPPLVSQLSSYKGSYIFWCIKSKFTELCNLTPPRRLRRNHKTGLSTE